MARREMTKKEKLLAAMHDIRNEYGDGSIYTLGSKREKLEIPRWSTGIEDLDNIIGGGMPAGRIIEIFGPESAGKTTLLYHLMAQCEYAVDIPIEGTFDAKRAKIMGNRRGQLIVCREDYGEQAMATAKRFADSGAVQCLGIDSVPSLITKREFEEENTEKEGQRGRIAAMLSRNLPKLVHTCEKNGMTLVFINQIRDEMGGMLFGPTTHTPGGRALKHYCSLRLQVNRVEWIKIPNYSASNSSKDEIIGFIMNVKVVKSKVCNPLGECRIPCFFDRGFVSYDDFKDIRRATMKAHRLAAKGTMHEESEKDG